jgi:hypothetical protein
MRRAGADRAISLESGDPRCQRVAYLGKLDWTKTLLLAFPVVPDNN